MLMKHVFGVEQLDTFKGAGLNQTKSFGVASLSSILKPYKHRRRCHIQQKDAWRRAVYKCQQRTTAHLTKFVRDREAGAGKSDYRKLGAIAYQLP